MRVVFGGMIKAGVVLTIAAFVLALGSTSHRERRHEALVLD
jgi:hypothetical protein